MITKNLAGDGGIRGQDQQVASGHNLYAPAERKIADLAAGRSHGTDSVDGGKLN
jgi:hypothetical protein